MCLCGAIHGAVAQTINFSPKTFVSGRVGHKKVQNIRNDVSCGLGSCYYGEVACQTNRLTLLHVSYKRYTHTITYNLGDGWLVVTDIVLVDLVNYPSNIPFEGK
jgi:hypothetical protein